jgi:hypothetical protein
MMMSSHSHRKLFAISFAAVAISLFGNLTVWTVSHYERQRIEKLARENAVLARKTNEGLICLLQRAIATVRANPGRRDTYEVEQAVTFYNREIALLGGRRNCADPNEIEP